MFITFLNLALNLQSSKSHLHNVTNFHCGPTLEIFASVTNKTQSNEFHNLQTLLHFTRLSTVRHRHSLADFFLQ